MQNKYFMKPILRFLLCTFFLFPYSGYGQDSDGSLTSSNDEALSKGSPPSLIVQVVDPSWMPLPGASVKISTKEKTEDWKSYTDNDGNARFWLDWKTKYTIEAELSGFKRKRLKNIYLYEGSESSPTAYVQIKLDVENINIIIY